MKATREQVLVQVPKVCPICGAPTILSDDLAHLSCSNLDCEGKFSRKLEIFAKMIGLNNFGPNNCLLLSKKVSKFHELFTLSLQDIVDCGLGEGMSKKLLDEIDKIKNGYVPLDKFLASLCIPKMGPNTAKLLSNQYKTLDVIRSLTVLDIVSDIERAGEPSARILVNGIRNAEEEINALLNYFEVSDLNSKVSGQAFVGMIICITGTLSVDRNIWKEKIENNGGKFSTSVSKNTTCLICNQNNSTSSKFKKAVQLGIPIYTEDWLVNKLNSNV